jgi:hypothetical protein
MRPEDQRRKFEGSLLDFTKESWRWVEPSPFCTNWHIECMCQAKSLFNSTLRASFPARLAVAVESK